ncbi:MAG: hypothetical protein HC763_00025 [Hydrococcus sp. CRU_1_1]|nr:hypothetical protein [Hydrococcus sp. CRU_1_1]
MPLHCIKFFLANYAIALFSSSDAIYRVSTFALAVLRRMLPTPYHRRLY